MSSNFISSNGIIGKPEVFSSVEVTDRLDVTNGLGVGFGRATGSSVAPSSVLHVFEDSAAVDSTAGLLIEQDGAGDALCQFLLTGGQQYVMGIDNSDSDTFKLAYSENLNTNPVFSVATTGALTLSTAVTVSTSIGGAGSNIVSMTPIVAADNIAAGAGGAISIDRYKSTINADAGGDAFTLADGAVIGQLKQIKMLATAGGTCVVTPSNLSGGTTITFSVAGDAAELMWDGTNWVAIDLYNVLGTDVTPVLA